MPIAVTCQCGARLEIDEKFLGKAVPCPDCNRPLPTTPPPKPPPLEMPESRRISGLAVLSLALAIVGAFTLVGTLAAIGVGLYALREIARRPGKLEGANIARAGIATGAVMTLVCMVALVAPTVFGLDSFLREFKYASRRKFPNEKRVENIGLNEVAIDRPGERWQRWGVFESNNQNQSATPDDLILINAGDDAYLACQHVSVLLGDRDEDKKAKVLDRFKKSELVHLLNGGPLDREIADVELKDPPPENMREMLFDVRLGGSVRRVLIQYPANKNGGKVDMMVAVARPRMFELLEPDFRASFKTRAARP